MTFYFGWVRARTVCNIGIAIASVFLKKYITYILRYILIYKAHTHITTYKHCYFLKYQPKLTFPYVRCFTVTMILHSRWVICCVEHTGSKNGKSYLIQVLIYLDTYVYISINIVSFSWVKLVKKIHNSTFFLSIT